MPLLVRDMEGLQEALATIAESGRRIALVPTMGALHAGHVELARAAAKYADVVAASIFVNPLQFGPNEDFERYPRSLDDDMAKLEDAGVALVYAPDAEDLYPVGYATSVSAGEISRVLCGAFRPGHFDGVATVVTKLLMRFLPHAALFGEKDYQQLCIIKQVVLDLDIPVEIIGVPTVREADGLALSSRNAYLTADERKTAPKLHAALANAASVIHGRQKTVPEALNMARKELEDAGFKVDYVDLRGEDTLAALDEYEAGARLLAAAWLGKTRLIDNIALP